MSVKFPIGKVYFFLRTFWVESFLHGQVIKMSAYFEINGKLRKENWGDDINYWFLREIVEDPIISYDNSLLTRKTHRPYVLGIGSLLTLFSIDNSIVWGTGVLSTTDKIKGTPKEVRAVRGPLSRARLLAAGIECPEIYGDPALLLPRYYTPKVSKRYKLGIIPHYKDMHNPLLEKLKNDKDVLIIAIRDYGHWLDFIDNINQCNAIISSSLHGLIVSEAYGIPNLWVKFNEKHNGDDIKFHDFFLSIGHDRSVFILKNETTKKDIQKAFDNYKKGYIDLMPLVEACPFKLKPNVKIHR